MNETEINTALTAPEQRELPSIRMDDLMALSTALLKSRMLPMSIRKPEQVMAIILRGRELGIGPMEALTSLHVIKGKVVSATQLMLALIYRSGELEDIQMERGDPAKVTMQRKGYSPHIVTFGKEDAKRADLLKKDNYKKWPDVMFLWRAIAICARVVFPDVVGAVYSPTELGVEMRHDVIEGEYVREKEGALFVQQEPEKPEVDVMALITEGKSVEEIAVIVNKPPQVVKAMIGQA